MPKKPSPSSTSPPPSPPLRVWAERRADPDWDRFIAALVSLAMRQVEEDEEQEEEERE